MRIIILHQHFNTPRTGGAIRSYYLARALRDKGMTVDVFTAHNKAYKKEMVEGISVHYFCVPYDNSFGFYRRIFSFLQFIIKVLTKKKILCAAHCCYAISVPLTVGIPAWYIKKKYRIPFFFEVGDLWPDVPIDMGFIKNNLLKKSLLKIEKKIYREACAVIALSPSIEKSIQKKVPTVQTYCVPNMADTAFYQKKTKNKLLQKKYHVSNKFVITYIGTLGIANGLNYLIACAKEMVKTTDKVMFLICGEGAMRKKIEKSIRNLGLTNITLLESVDRAGVAEIMAVSDALMVCYKPISILETGCPNKFFDGLATGKLMIINFGGWIRREVEKYRCGLYVSPHDPSDFVKQIIPFLTDDELLDQYQKNARNLAENKYSRKRIAPAFATLIEARYGFYKKNLTKKKTVNVD